MSVKISCEGVWKIFGANPQNVLRDIVSAESHANSRAEILANTGHVVAVRDASFEVNEGDIFCVMGLSGSGKSTLIRCLTRLIEPTSGKIWVNGTNVVGMDEATLRKLRRNTMSMVFQRFGLFSHRRVVDNVAYGLEVQGLDPKQRTQKALEVIDLVGLNGWAQHYPHELSGGMQQRVGLARALAVDPEILLCDEPFSALDPLIRRDMQNELIHLQKDLQKTVVFITHDFLESLKLGDRVAIMKDGEIVQIGTPEQIVANPVNDYVAEFTKDVPRVKVLTARTIMQPLEQGASIDGHIVDIDTTLEKLIPLTADSDQPLPVMDELGNIVGTVNRKSVMLALASGD